MTTLPRSGILFLPPADGHDYAIMTEFGPEVVRLFAGEVHSSRSGIASSADSAGTEAPKAAPPEAPRLETARPYRSRQTMVTGSPWKIARTAISANLAAGYRGNRPLVSSWPGLSRQPAASSAEQRRGCADQVRARRPWAG